MGKLLLLNKALYILNFGKGRNGLNNRINELFCSGIRVIHRASTTSKQTYPQTHAFGFGTCWRAKELKGAIALLKAAELKVNY